MVQDAPLYAPDFAPYMHRQNNLLEQLSVHHAPRGCTVQRIYAPVDEATLEKVDKDAAEKGISRAQWVSTAIGAYLHREETLSGADLEEMHRELVQLRTEKEQSWREITHLKRTEEKARTEATHAQARAEKLQAELEQANKDMAGVREELVAARAEADKLREAMGLKNDEVSFLRGHVAQLTQSISQLALPPSQEEAGAKSWWQFWR
jgi:chromosome segregation ATPase